MMRRVGEAGWGSVPLQHQAIPRRNTYENPTSLSWTLQCGRAAAGVKATSELIINDGEHFQCASRRSNLTCLFWSCKSDHTLARRSKGQSPAPQKKARRKKNGGETGAEGLTPRFRLSLSEGCVMMWLFKESLQTKGQDDPL